MKCVCLSVFLLLILLALESIEAARGSRGGGSRSRSSSRSRSRSSSGSGSSRRSYKYGPYKGNVNKYTPIPVRSKTSPVIVKQTKPLASRSNLYTRVFVGSMLYRYTIHNGPIYRRRYRTYTGEVVIPEERAIRISSMEDKLLDSNDELCLKLDGQRRNLLPDINERVLFANTEIDYSDGRKMVSVGKNKTVEIDKSVLDQDVKVKTLIKYNGTIIEDTNCTQISSFMEGTVVRLYDTNPDDGGIIKGSIPAILFSFLVYFIASKLETLD